MPLNPNIILQQERPNMARPVAPVDPVKAQIDAMTLRKLQQQEQDEQTKRQVLAQGGGVRERTLAAIQQNPQAAPFLAELMKPFDEADAAAERVRKAKFDLEQSELGYFGHLAAQVQAAKYDPGILNLALQHAEENGHDTAPIRQLIEQRPDQVQAVVDGIMARAGIKPERVTPEAVKTREITTTLPDGSTKIEIVEDKPGQSFTSAPKPVTAGSGNPNEAALALAAAKGDKAAEAALRLLNPIKTGSPKGKAVTSGDANRIADLNNSLRELGELRSTLTTSADTTGLGAQIGAALPKAVTAVTGWGTAAKEKQAVIDRVKQVIGKSLEGGVLRKEDEVKYAKILPTIGDTADVVAAKLTGLEQALSTKRDEQFSALEDAGYDLTKFRARTGGSESKPAEKQTQTPTHRYNPKTGKIEAVR